LTLLFKYFEILFMQAQSLPQTQISLEALMILDLLDSKGSLIAAAREVHRVPSALTYTLQKLESDLGLKLLTKQGRKLQLTVAGSELLRGGRQILRAAKDLEVHVKKVAAGWEPEIRIAVDNIIDIELLYPIMSEFLALNSGTRVKTSYEVLGGSWDALITDRADLVIGAPGDTPSALGLSSSPLGATEFIFAASPLHPITKEHQPLTPAVIAKYRSIAVSDTSIGSQPRTVGILPGQEVLNVPNMKGKLSAQIYGLGVGYLPRRLATEALANGQLIELKTQERPQIGQFNLAWKTRNHGPALTWFKEKFLASSFKSQLPF
jgi:DNA-binding transcriptional LysR family regulator